MDVLYWLVWQLKEVFPVEMALTLGVVFFGLSWIRPRRIISFSPGTRRLSVLTATGVAGSLAVLAVASLANALALTDPLQTNWGGWWQRPLPLLAAACVIALAAIVMKRAPMPPMTQGAIVPRRHWWAFASPTLLWLAAACAVALLLTVTWHSAIGVSAPAGADRYGIGPLQKDLPVYMAAPDGVGYIWGAGWPHHLATMVVLLLAAAVSMRALASDANRPGFALGAAGGGSEDRRVTARLFTLVFLGGVLLTLGAVWAHIGFIGEFIVGIYPQVPGRGGQPIVNVGTGYGDFAFLMHKGGYVLQGVGAALLLRLAIDSIRARRAVTRDRQAPAERAEASVDTSTEIVQ
ncbi:hypothetical protein ACXR2T_03660 [Leucobacter sp. HY1910]